MSEKRFRTVGIGEVLFDVLPSGAKMLGGAPANFAFVSGQLGDDGIVLSRVGDDADGREIAAKLQAENLAIKNLQIDRARRTGTVNVTLENGQPNYQIAENAAWDFLELTADWREIAWKIDAVCFGSLAQRNRVSRETILAFVKLVKGRRVFDVNLRQHYFSIEILRQSFELAGVVKLNHEELLIIAEMFEIKTANQTETARRLRAKFDLELLCVTRGADGSLLLTADEIDEHSGFKIRVADTIGAGDAFTAGLTHGFLRGWKLNEINQFANRVGAFVASNTGAMPLFSQFLLDKSETRT